MIRIVVFVLLAQSFIPPAHAQEAPRFDLQVAIADGPPLTADEAAERASAASPGLERAEALSRASEAAVSQARAAMLPRLELSARYTRVGGFPDGEISLGGDPEALAAARSLAETLDDPAARALWLGSLDNQGGSVAFTIPRDQYGLSARLTWPVSDLFFAMLPALEAAESAVEAREAAREVADATVRLRAREAYFQLARARGGFAVAEQSARQAVAQRDQIASGVDAGVLTEADRMAAEARVATAESAVASARAGVEMADAALRMLMGLDPGPAHGVVEPLFETSPAPGPLAPRLERAVEARPEVRSLRAGLATQRAAGRAIDAQGYPHLGLYAGADVGAPNRYVIPPNSDPQPSWEVGAMISWSPNDTLNAVHAGEASRAQQAETEARLVELERGVRLEVQQADSRARAALAASESGARAVTAAEAAYASRLAQLRAGQTTTAALFAAEGELNRARLNRLDAAVQLRLALAQLRRASGE
ncbi:MAG: TolC family protein [Sandaracinaceae bacterium]